jgi:uncharacterized membrane protein
MASKPMFLFIGTYPSEDSARSDEEIVKQLYRDNMIGTYDAARVVRDAEGKVHFHRSEKPTQHGTEIGAGVGLVATGVATAVATIFFAPIVIAGAIGVAADTAAGVVSGGVVGGVAGGLIGHVRKGLSRQELDEIGRLLNDSTAALVVVGESKVDQALTKAELRATKSVEKQLQLDVERSNQDLNAAMEEVTAPR